MKLGTPLPDLHERVRRLAGTARDFIAPSSRLTLVPNDQQFDLHLGSVEHQHITRVSELVHEQLAEHLQIPLDYYRRLRERLPALLVDNVNGWLRGSSERRLVRAHQGDDGRLTARAYLSDRYRPLDNLDLLEAVLPTLERFGVHIESCELTDQRLYLKAVNPRQQGEVRVGEVVQAGVLISNSEVGCGALTIKPLVFTLRCRNGLISDDISLRQHHLGRRQAGDDSIREFLSDEARRAEDRAFFLKARDVTAAALDKAIFHRQLERLQSAAKQTIKPADVDAVIEVTAKRFGLTDDERAGVLAQLAISGDATRWGLSSAVTSFAQLVGDYDRSTELERVGGRIVEMRYDEWCQLVSVN